MNVDKNLKVVRLGNVSKNAINLFSSSKLFSDYLLSYFIGSLEPCFAVKLQSASIATSMFAISKIHLLR